ncbi:cytochrome c oxidase assembly protein [Paracoccus albicereus]|uniref:cytochrome c oxidase assembly protein n=1 Tax=Paracoccus albicereus TaxID=2922394 RepID=UPI00350E5641
MALLVLTWLPDWPARLGPFPGHMLRHMVLVAVAAPLIVLGWPALSRLAPSIMVAVVLEAVIVWSAHLPQLHAATRLAPHALVMEQALFLIAGLAVWSGALHAGSALAGAGGLLLTSMHMTMLGTILILAPSDIYAAFCGTAPDLHGQQIGGILMLAIGTPIYLLAGLWLSGRALQGSRA